MSHSVAVESKTFVPRGDFMAWVVCLSAGLFFLYEFFQLNIFDVINQSLREDFHIDATQLSWMSSTYLWADILFLLPAGLILDRFSTRKVILTAMFVCVVGTIGFAVTESFFLASFFHFLSGIGNAFCFLSCVVLVSHWFPPRRQALVIGSLVTMAFIGGMMAHTPFAYLNDLFGWRRALLIDGVVGAFLILWIYMIVQDRPEKSPAHKLTNEGQILTSFMKALSNKQNWLAGLYTSLLNLPIMVLCALWGASYLQVAHHLPDIAASNVVSLIFMGSVVGCPLVGWLSDTQGRRKPLMIFGAIATLITTIPLFINVVLTQMSLSILFFALGLFTSTQVISYPLVAESNQPENTGAATGIASVIIMGGGGVAQVLFGWLMAHHAGTNVTAYTVSDFQFAMWMFPVAAIAGLVAVLMTRETYCKR
ncbi:TPA: MFS transporter [Legionella pneumophila]|uniref:Lysosomal dipeptide transporter MFSD1 n=1 Tax=Legionella pneumophila TaxID=446 RepID=A0A378K6I3_LEGPN|nr:MFS transporter [Legionella pneumophila]MDC8031277.1 Sugar phosphate permease [Legionella pneumophila subsp. pneumophila]MDW8871085.1 MFS transporter [Legionella pneumophila]MDW8902133.1 MFS transporter [Legionella pneumophila]MDW8907822.1 MFS transporter [Legionella pneumophila]MDW8917039.1 MFS transporter [Legionella pneumophila]